MSLVNRSNYGPYGGLRGLWANMPRMVRAARSGWNAARAAHNAFSRAGSQASYTSYAQRYSHPTPSVYAPSSSRGRFVSRRFRRRVRRRLAPRMNRARVLRAQLGRRPALKMYKRRRNMRKFNKGAMNLLRNMSNGDTLPSTTFARLSYQSGPDLIDFSTSPTPIFLMNAIIPKQSPSVLDAGVRYQGVWSLLYAKHAVLGSKLNIKLDPSMLPRNTTFSAANQQQLSQRGYYYLRVYVPGSTFTPPRPDIGYPMDSGTQDGVLMQTIWQTEDDFLGDRTVTYKRDPMTVRKYQDVTFNTSTNLPTVNTAVRVESNNKPVSLTYKFSYKKLFQIRDVMQKINYVNWDAEAVTQCMVRIGYVSFSSGTGGPVFSNQWQTFYNMRLNHSSYVTLRDPIELHNADTLDGVGARLSLLQSRAAVEEVEEIEDDDEFEDDLLEDEPVLEVPKVINE